MGRPKSDQTYQAIDQALEKWRQGDCLVGEFEFVFRLDLDLPLTKDAKDAAQEGVDLVETPCEGAVVLSQTCDIVRSCINRPFLEIAPLVFAAPELLEQVKKGLRPNYAFIPGVAEKNLVADLDRVMTVEKAVVALWDRTIGCDSCFAARHFAESLSRKRARPAFPDDFSECLRPLLKKIKLKHGKELSEEGRAFRALQEIRVRAAPDWKSDQIDVFFWFIRNPREDDTGIIWTVFIENWVDLFKITDRYFSVKGAAVFLEDMTALDYVESDPLDLDYLSS